jgi:hypothetical protein
VSILTNSPLVVKRIPSKGSGLARKPVTAELLVAEVRSSSFVLPYKSYKLPYKSFFYWTLFPLFVEGLRKRLLSSFAHIAQDERPGFVFPFGSRGEP